MEKKVFTDIIDLFVKNIKNDTDIKRVNFIVYKDIDKKDTIFKTMNLDSYLDKTLKKEKLMFNLIDSDYTLCKKNLLNILLTNRKENLTIIVIDVFKNYEDKTRLKRVKEVKNISDNLKRVMKTINLINSNVPVYLMGLNNKENNLSKKLINNIYKDVIKKYNNVYYVDNHFDDKTTASSYNMLMELLNGINETLLINQTKLMFEKAVKESINEDECQDKIDTIIKHQRINGVSIYDIKESMEEYLEVNNNDKTVATIFKERIKAAKRVIEKRVNI